MTLHAESLSNILSASVSLLLPKKDLWTKHVDMCYPWGFLYTILLLFYVFEILLDFLCSGEAALAAD